MENYFTALIFSKSRIKPPQFLYFLPGSQLVTPNFLSVVVGNLGNLGNLGNVAWTQNISSIRKPSRARKRGGVQIFIVYITDTHKNCGKVKKICEGRLFSVEQGKGKHLHVN